MPLKIRKHISFDEKTHTYRNTKTNEIYISATKFISKFHEPFDGQKIAKYLLDNVPSHKQRYREYSRTQAVKLILDEWTKSAIQGNNVHKVLEDYVIEKKLGSHFRHIQLINAFNSLNILEEHKDWEVCAEMILFIDEYKIAGQSDLVLINHKEKTFKILDYKTCKKGISENAYGKKMYAPIAYLPDSKYYHYSLQLNLYAYFLSKETGYKCVGMTLLWVDINSQEKIEIKAISVKDKQKEIKLLLEYC